MLDNAEKVVSWKSRDLLSKKFATPPSTDNSFSQQLKRMEILSFVWHFKKAT